MKRKLGPWITRRNMVKQTMNDEFVCVAAIEFADGSAEYMLLSRGRLKQCESVMNGVPGISYSGVKPVKNAHVMVIPSSEYDALPTQ